MPKLSQSGATASPEEPSEWMRVKHVRQEMGLTTQEAWKLVKKLGVKVLDPENANSSNALFLRAEFEEARQRSMGLPVDRQEEKRAQPKERARSAEPSSLEAKLARLRTGS